MTNLRSIPPPKGLQLRGRGLWKQVTKAYKLRLDELVLLEFACKTLDLLQKLEQEMDGQPLTTKGSMGQEREHPLLSEARQQRIYLNRTLAQLKLPDLAVGAEINKNRAAANARWSHPSNDGAGQSRWSRTHGAAQ